MARALLKKAHEKLLTCWPTTDFLLKEIGEYLSQPEAQQERKPHTEAEVHRILYFVHVDFLKEAEEKVRAILGVPAP